MWFLLIFTFIIIFVIFAAIFYDNNRNNESLIISPTFTRNAEDSSNILTKIDENSSEDDAENVTQIINAEDQIFNQTIKYNQIPNSNKRAILMQFITQLEDQLKNDANFDNNEQV